MKFQVTHTALIEADNDDSAAITYEENWAQEKYNYYECVVVEILPDESQ